MSEEPSATATIRFQGCRPGLGEVHDRPPAQPPTPFGMTSAERYAAGLGSYGAAG